RAMIEVGPVRLIARDPMYKVLPAHLDVLKALDIPYEPVNPKDLTQQFQPVGQPMKAPRPRKLRLTPLQGQLLRILEEAGEEEITCAANTLHLQFPMSSVELLLQAFTEIQRLLEMGFVSAAHEREGVRENLEGVASVLKFLRFDPERNLWIWDVRQGGNHPVRLILEQRGEQALRS